MKSFKNVLQVFRGQRVLVTGHTGFKGSWLCIWLEMLGAREIHGIALAPHTNPSLFEESGVSAIVKDHRLDIRNFQALEKMVREIRPDTIFHLAAQPLVRLSYEVCRETFETNFLGTVNLLEAAKSSESVQSFVHISTDKCYRNVGKVEGYREGDPFGGHDPYSASKAAAEVAFESYLSSFFQVTGRPLAAAGRAGNVIGGGDWAVDRIVPDCIRSLAEGKPIPVRNPTSTRPWQHTLEALSGYLMLGGLLGLGEKSIQGGWNFGPSPANVRTVADLVQEVLSNWKGGRWVDASDPNAPHEAALLSLDCGKAHRELGWSPRWNFEETIRRTVGWYREHLGGTSALELCRRDIAAYMEAW